MKCVVLLLCVTCIYAVKFRCDYQYYANIGWLKYNEIPMAWRDARLQCHLQGAEIASPTDLNILNIMKNSTGNGPILTGIHSTFSKGQFYTIDGIPLSKIPCRWARFASEPDNMYNDENCIELNFHGDISDTDCDEAKPFLCHRKDTNKDVTMCGTPDTEYHFDSRTNKCYKFHTTPRQFQRALFACFAEGGHLAIINSKLEAEVITDLFAKYPKETMIGNFWKDVAFIGFHNWGESADWTTIHGQSLEEAGFALFADGQPDNATTGEYCGSVLRSGLLNDLWCENHYPFICEKKPNFPPVCDTNEID